MTIKISRRYALIRTALPFDSNLLTSWDPYQHSDKELYTSKASFVTKPAHYPDSIE
jgi:hypothetical protein